jgi:hypothetical protein
MATPKVSGTSNTREQISSYCNAAAVASQPMHWLINWDPGGGSAQASCCSSATIRDDGAGTSTNGSSDLSVSPNSHRLEELFPNDYNPATAVLEMIRLQTESKVDELFSIGRRCWPQSWRREAGATLQERLQQVAQVLEEQGYMPEIMELQEGRERYR